uniref:Cwf18 pre-mRNA splicing factor n=1 Tax=Ditylum brightwellii TaxID=49249 RepID=A0A7S4V4W8_9STRA
MAEDRKARLAALAARAGRSKNPSSNEENDAATEIENSSPRDDAQPSLRFRNYAPKDSSLDREATPTSGAGEGTSKQQQTTVDARLELMAQRAKRQKTENGRNESKTPLEQALLKAKLENVMEASSSGAGTIGATGDLEINDMSAIAPKKVNWDLKRDIKSKIDRLERRTERAIVDLLRERLEKEATEEAAGMDEDTDESDLD